MTTPEQLRAIIAAALREAFIAGAAEMSVTGIAIRAAEEYHKKHAGPLADEIAALLRRIGPADGELKREWQLIESAPTDGRPVLCGRIGVKPYFGRWCKTNREWLDHATGYAVSRDPTHWFDLPLLAAAPVAPTPARGAGGSGGFHPSRLADARRFAQGLRNDLPRAARR